MLKKPRNLQNLKGNIIALPTHPSLSPSLPQDIDFESNLLNIILVESRMFLGWLNKSGEAGNSKGIGLLLSLVGKSEANTCHVSQDKQRVAVGYKDGSIHIWNAQTAQPVSNNKCKTFHSTSIQHSYGFTPTYQLFLLSSSLFLLSFESGPFSFGSYRKDYRMLVFPSRRWRKIHCIE